VYVIVCIRERETEGGREERGRGWRREREKVIFS